MFARLKRVVLATVAPLMLAAFGQALGNEEFRIETDIFVDNEPEPVSRTVTLFEQNAVYDFTENPAQTVVYRRGTQERPGRFILLDPTRRLRTDVATDLMGPLLAKVAQWAAEQDDAILRFSAQPEFSLDFDSQTGALTLDSDVWTYRVATTPAQNPSALARYRDFTDWYARLNSMLHNTPPPGPRLKLNEELERRGLIPVEINRTISPSKTAVRAAHLFSWRLSREDRERLDAAQQHLASFKKVDNETYMRK